MTTGLKPKRINLSEKRKINPRPNKRTRDQETAMFVDEIKKIAIPY